MSLDWWTRVIGVILLIAGACYLDGIAHRRTLPKRRSGLYYYDEEEERYY